MAKIPSLQSVSSWVVPHASITYDLPYDIKKHIAASLIQTWWKRRFDYIVSNIENIDCKIIHTRRNGSEIKHGLQTQDYGVWITKSPFVFGVLHGCVTMRIAQEFRCEFMDYKRNDFRFEMNEFRFGKIQNYKYGKEDGRSLNLDANPADVEDFQCGKRHGLRAIFMPFNASNDRHAYQIDLFCNDILISTQTYRRKEFEEITESTTGMYGDDWNDYVLP